MKNVFDVIVIGAGPAGEIAAARAVRAGLTTAVVERRWAGGELAGPIDTAAVTARRDEFVAHYDDGPQVSWVEKLPATFARGQGRLAGGRIVRVTAPDGDRPGSTLIENNPKSSPHEEGASAAQNYLYVLAQGLSQIVGYRVGADGSVA